MMIANSQPSVVSRYARAWQLRSTPNLGRFLNSEPDLDPEDLVAICCLDLRERIEHGLSVRSEDYIDLLSTTSSDSEPLLDLIYTEFLARRGEGVSIEVAEFVDRFPALADRITRLLQVDELLGGETTADLGGSTPCSSNETIPSRIGRFPILRQLDSGGQGVIFQGLHPTLQTPVVVKWSRDRLSELDREMLLAEGRALAALDHPNICRIYDLDFESDRPFLVMELIPGSNLHQRVQDTPIDDVQIAKWMGQIARALEAAHRQGLIHRDLKPKNVLIDSEGNATLIDFGLARIRSAWNPNVADSDRISGSVGFMAPEQANGREDEISPRTDLFAFGATLYYLLTKRVPIPGADAIEVLANARRGHWDEAPLQESHLSRPLVAICRRCLSPRIGDRPESAAQLAEELERLARRSKRPNGKLLLAGICAVFLAAIWLRSLSRHPEVAEPSAPASLTATVWVRDRYVPLPEPAPVARGGKVRIEATVGKDRAASLLSLTASGKWTRLVYRDAHADSDRLNYPAEPNRSIRVEGDATEIVVLMTGDDEAVRTAEAWLFAVPAEVWPKLPLESVLSLEEVGVRRLQASREFTLTEEQPNPEGEVVEKLRSLQAKLREMRVNVRALAFRSTRG